MVFKAARLWFYFMIYSGKDKYKGRHFVKKRSSRYARWQQKCAGTQRGVMDKKNYSWNNNVEKIQVIGGFQSTGRNTKK